MRERAHTLSAEEESILAAAGELDQTGVDVLHNDAVDRVAVPAGIRVI